MANKVCPVVFRVSGCGVELLAFTHPSAGKQFVKGTIREGELALDAARRELREESGIAATTDPIDLGQFPIDGQSRWHFFALRQDGLPESWEHQTEDDFGHTFSFFWHPVEEALDQDWHHMFHKALQIIRTILPV